MGQSEVMEIFKGKKRGLLSKEIYEIHLDRFGEINRSTLSHSLKMLVKSGYLKTKYGGYRSYLYFKI
jgi:Fe2+ or Zn2+ uptake regulation protein